MSCTPVKAAVPSPLRDMNFKQCAACPKANSNGGFPGKSCDSTMGRGRGRGRGRECKKLYIKLHGMSKFGKDC